MLKETHHNIKWIRVEHKFTLVISNLTAKNSILGFYIFNITGFKDGESYTKNWFLKVDNVSSIANDTLLKEVSLYPNPTKSQISINSSNVITNSKVTITNSAGQICYLAAFPLASNQIDIDLSKLVNGIYFIQLQTEEGIASWRFIKH